MRCAAAMLGLFFAAGCSSGASGGGATPGPDAVVDARATDANDDEAAVEEAAVEETGGEIDAASAPDAVEAEDAVVAVDAVDAADAPPTECPLPPACEAPPLTLPPRVEWRHSVATRITVNLGAAHHRGRDLFYTERDPQWLIAKFAYGFADDDLKDEDVDVYVLRGCSGTTWERLGTGRTTNDGSGPAIEGVPDSGGRVYFPVPAAQRLGVGWHRVRFVVRGDQTTADAFINVLPAGARVVVSDVDGTLTESENAEFFSTLTGGPSPGANPGAAAALTVLARRGFHIMYLTARPEFVVERSRAWFRANGFPAGILHTTTGILPLVGASAEQFKAQELAALTARVGMPPTYAFGNKDSDVAAYTTAGVAPAHSYYFQLAGDLRGGVRNDDYRTLITPFTALEAICR